MLFHWGGSPALMLGEVSSARWPLCIMGGLMARDFAQPFYHSPEWQRVRQAVLMRDRFLCVKCGAPAEEVHHKIHLSPSNIGDTNITMNPENLISLCRECHFNEHRGDHAGGRKAKETADNYPYEFDANGNLIEKRNNPPVLT